LSSPLFFCDSAVVVSVLVKGRSSSYPLLRLGRRVCALCLALGVSPRVYWIPSAANPADADSRFLNE